MKSFTDIEQSKKLAEFLSVESADMHYVRKTYDFMGNQVDGEWSHPKYGNPNSKHANYIVQNFETLEKIPCWSLAALLGILPPYLYEWEKGIDFNLYPSVAKKRWWCAGYISQDLSTENKDKFTLIIHADNPVDAAFEMLLKLKEKNLL